MGVFGKRGKDEIDDMIKFIENPYNLEDDEDEYLNILGRALYLVEGEDKDHVLSGQKHKFPRLKSAIKRALEESVGYKIKLTDDANYEGKIGIPSSLQKIYNLNERAKIRIGPLTLTPNILETSELLTLHMYRKDAQRLLGPSRVKESENGEIKPVYIKISPVMVEEREKKRPLVNRFEELFK